MHPVARQGLLLCVVAAVVVAAAAAAGSLAGSPRFRVAVVAPDDPGHLAWAAASQLQRNAQVRGRGIAVESAALTGTGNPLPLLFVMPVRSLAVQVPALQVLELPFFYPSLNDVHNRLDGSLGAYLADAARKRGWEIVAYWDEGMHVFSGLKRYDRARNLKAREFLITRPDPVTEKQFRYWKADARRINPGDRDAVLRECLIASRAATLQEIVREELYRVHLAMSLTSHRYEGWVVVAPAERWAGLEPGTREKLGAALRETTDWQREDARQREVAALAELKRRGMTIYAVDADELEAFRRTLPDYAELLSDELTVDQKRELVDLASTGAAPVVRPAAPAQTRHHAAPDTAGR
jgi:TRAP-type C4-dicarboxylate transport system substrate-binding protein